MFSGIALFGLHFTYWWSFNYNNVQNINEITNPICARTRLRRFIFPFYSLHFSLVMGRISSIVSFFQGPPFSLSGIRPFSCFLLVEIRMVIVSLLIVVLYEQDILNVATSCLFISVLYEMSKNYSIFSSPLLL